MNERKQSKNPLPINQVLDLEMEKADPSFEKRYIETCKEIERLQKVLVKNAVEIKSLKYRVGALEKEIKEMPNPVNVIFDEKDIKA